MKKCSICKKTKEIKYKPTVEIEFSNITLEEIFYDIVKDYR